MIMTTSPKRKLNQKNKQRQQQQQQQATITLPSHSSNPELSSMAKRRQQQVNASAIIAPQPISTAPRKSKGGSFVGERSPNNSNRPLRHSYSSVLNHSFNGHSTNRASENEVERADYNPSPSKKQTLFPPNQQQNIRNSNQPKTMTWATKVASPPSEQTPSTSLSSPTIPATSTALTIQQSKATSNATQTQEPTLVGLSSSSNPLLFNIAPTEPTIPNPQPSSTPFTFTGPTAQSFTPRSNLPGVLPAPWGRLSSKSSAKSIELLSKEDPEFFPLLEEEIQLFTSWIVNTPEEQKAREGIVDKIQEISRRLWPRSSVKVIGSFATGLSLPTSDIDLVVFGVDNSMRRNQGRFMDPMELFASQLRRERIPKEMQLITRARVPIIKLVDAKTNYRVDISFEVADGVKNTELVKSYLSSNPLVQPIVLILKFLLSFYKLNETFTGGLGSYALTLLVLFHAQLHPNLGAAELLTSFLFEFGFKFDYENTGLSLTNKPNFFSKKERGWHLPYQPFLLSLEDPAAIENDVGRGSFNVIKIREAFQNAYQELTAPPPDYAYSSSLLGRVLWPTPELMERLGSPIIRPQLLQ